MVAAEIIEKIISHLKLSNKKINSTWVSTKIGIVPKTFMGKLSRKSLSADELIQIAEGLDLDLNKFKGRRHLTDIKALDFIIKKPSHKNVKDLIDLTNPNLAVIGNAGYGKTNILINILKDCIKKGEKVVFISMRDISEFRENIKQLNAKQVNIDALDEINETMFDNSVVFVGFGYALLNNMEEKASVVNSIIKEAGKYGVERIFISEALDLMETYIQGGELSRNIPLIVDMQPDYTLFETEEKMQRFKAAFSKVVLLHIHDIRFYDVFKKSFNLDEEYEMNLRYCEVGKGVIIDSNDNNYYFENEI